MADIYYSPEQFGLEIVKELDDPSADYSFDKFVVWIRKKDGVLFYGQDSGCSCPSPFEGVTSVQGLSELKNMKAFEQELRAWGSQYYDAQTLQSFIDRISVVKVYKCTLL